jgi:hypothetical protein
MRGHSCGTHWGTCLGEYLLGIPLGNPVSWTHMDIWDPAWGHFGGPHGGQHLENRGSPWEVPLGGGPGATTIGEHPLGDHSCGTRLRQLNSGTHLRDSPWGGPLLRVSYSELPGVRWMGAIVGCLVVPLTGDTGGVRCGISPGRST